MSMDEQFREFRKHEICSEFATQEVIDMPEKKIWKDWFGNSLDYILITPYRKENSYRFTCPKEAIKFVEEYEEESVPGASFHFGYFEILTLFTDGLEHRTKGRNKDSVIQIIRWMFEWSLEDGEPTQRGLI